MDIPPDPRLYLINSSGKPAIGAHVRLDYKRIAPDNKGTISLKKLVGTTIKRVCLNCGTLNLGGNGLLIKKDTILRIQYNVWTGSVHILNQED